MFKQVIFKTGEMGHTSYKILKGEVECVAVDPLSNKKIEFNRHGVGEFIAQICLINPKYKHFYDCIAVERFRYPWLLLNIFFFIFVFQNSLQL